MGAYTVTGQRARQMRVVPAEVLKRLYARSDRHGLVQTAGHLALLVAGGWLVLLTRDTWWVVPALLVQGLFINSLFGAMHESVHYGSFKTRWMADALAFFSGAAILNNAGFYRHYHMAHHRYTQDPARDPELVTSGTPRTWGQYLFRVSSIPFLMLRVRDIFLFPFGHRGDVDYIHPSAWPEVRRWGRWLLALYGALIVGSIALQTAIVLWVWFFPLLAGLPFLRLYLLCEHTLCPNSDDGFANTRTTLSNP
ncbi:MAG: fatty acid desaturase, partial [Burkholderiales bacterium]